MPLGLFKDIERAKKVESQARSLDLPAEIVPRTREGTVYFVDIGMPPGWDVIAMINYYGEDKITLGDEATCP